MDRRELTGKWYLSKRTFGGFNVMVQVEIERWRIKDITSKGYYAPKRTEYQKALGTDLIELGINCA